MSMLELFVLAVGLSMDAFAVSVCKGLSLVQIRWKHSVLAGLYFGIFQAGMPVVGYLLGTQFQGAITFIDHWIAFLLLGIIGFNMIKEALSKESSDHLSDPSFSMQSMLILSVATSIDALAVGITFAFLNVEIVPAVLFIGSITFFLSFFGVRAGNMFGIRYKAKAELAGGIILVGIGIKILVEHVFF